MNGSMYFSQEWVDVKQALPKISDFEETIWVLVCDSMGNVFTAKFMQCDKEGPAEWYEFGRDGYRADNIRFWMELPSSPIDEQNMVQQNEVEKYQTLKFFVV